MINKYKPRTVQSRAEKKLKFAESKLEDWTKDPDEWLDSLEELKSDLELMNSGISNEDFKIHLLNNLPKEYESLLEKLIPDISILSLSDLREELQSKFKQLAKYSDGENLEDDQALNTGSGFWKKFKGKCRTC